MDVVIQHAELNHAAGRGLWRLSVDRIRDDGTVEKSIAFFPSDAIEWRVAQFNVTPAQAAEMIVLEPDAPDTLHDQELAPSRSEARALKQASLDEALAGGTITWATGAPEWSASLVDMHPEEVLVDSGDGDPLETVLAFSPVDDAAVEAKREILDMHRAQHRRRVEQREASTPEPEPKAKRGGPKVGAGIRVHRDPDALLQRRTPDELRRAMLPPPRQEEALLSAVSEAQPSELAERVLGKRIEVLRQERDKDAPR